MIVPLSALWLLGGVVQRVSVVEVHINVIVCTGSSPVKYLIKYIHKGADMSVVRAAAKDDEISQYEKSVYIGPIDSAWRLWSFPWHGQSQAVYRLNYHEPTMQPINWPTGISDTEFRVRLEETISPLLAWFRYNLDHRGGWQRRLLYPEFPEHFTFSKAHKKWTPRGNINVIGRMYVSYPGQGERYYMRLLLCHQRGCTSFEDLRTVQGNVCNSWEEAAQRLGLLDNGSDWMDMFQELGPLHPGWVLRQLFVLALRLLDTGAEGKWFVDKDWAVDNGFTLQRLKAPIRLETFDRQEAEDGPITHYVKASMRIQDDLLVRGENAQHWCCQAEAARETEASGVPGATGREGKTFKLNVYSLCRRPMVEVSR